MIDVKKDCFAYIKKGNKEECHALTELDCKNCRFYKSKYEVENNPFYAKSYVSKEEHQKEMKKRNIKEEQVKWD